MTGGPPFPFPLGDDGAGALPSQGPPPWEPARPGDSHSSAPRGPQQAPGRPPQLSPHQGSATSLLPGRSSGAGAAPPSCLTPSSQGLLFRWPCRRGLPRRRPQLGYQNSHITRRQPGRSTPKTDRSSPEQADPLPRQPNPVPEQPDPLPRSTPTTARQIHFPSSKIYSQNSQIHSQRRGSTPTTAARSTRKTQIHSDDNQNPLPR